MSETRDRTKWLARVRFIQGEYGKLFGPVRYLYNEDGQLQDKNGEPAIRTPHRITHYRNGMRHGIDVDRFGTMLYYFNGVLVPNKYLRNPEALTIEEILKHPNTEVRRVGMEIYGFDRLIEEERATIIDEDDKGQQLLSIDIKDSNPMTMVRVLDGTPLPNGEREVYFLQVPPDMKRVKQAVAWTFYRNEETYQPQVET